MGLLQMGKNLPIAGLGWELEEVGSFDRVALSKPDLCCASPGSLC